LWEKYDRIKHLSIRIPRSEGLTDMRHLIKWLVYREKRYTFIMALLLDIEPPSSRNDKDDKNNSKRDHLAIKFKSYWVKFLQTNRNLSKGLYFLSQKTWLKVGHKVEIIHSKIKSFFAKIVDNKLLPHLTISFLFVIVAFSNINDRVQAYYLTHEINNLDPNVQLAVVSDIDQYTPNINKDTQVVEKSISTSNYSSGFIYNAVMTDTQITARTEPLPDNSKDTVYYVVRDNDTLSGIGWKFGVKLATLAYTNDLSNTDKIKPGVRLKIPPRGYEVSRALIAAKQNAKNAATLASKATATKNAAAKSAISRPAGSIRNAYPYGYCTYLVATRRAVPGNWGNGGQWLNSARNAGYPTGSTPVAGAIMVSSESFWGHVAYVESVNGNEFTIVEMNARGWGVTSRRTMNKSDRVIKGFVY